VVAQAPPDATVVVFHSAALTYLDPADRARFVATIHGLPVRWISNEGPAVLTLDPAPLRHRPHSPERSSWRSTEPRSPTHRAATAKPRTGCPEPLQSSHGGSPKDAHD